MATKLVARKREKGRIREDAKETRNFSQPDVISVLRRIAKYFGFNNSSQDAFPLVCI